MRLGYWSLSASSGKCVCVNQAPLPVLRFCSSNSASVKQPPPCPALILVCSSEVFSQSRWCYKQTANLFLKELEQHWELWGFKSCVCLPVSCRPSAAGGGDICRCLWWVPGSYHEHSDVWPSNPAFIPCHCGSVNHSPAPAEVWNVGLSASLLMLSFLSHWLLFMGQGLVLFQVGSLG